MKPATDRGERPQLTIVGPSMPASTLAYLATPYTNYCDGIEIAFREASRIAGDLLMAGVHCYSPIAHCHPLSIHAQIDALDRDFWLRYQESFMARCDVLIVAQMKGWKESSGVNHEIAFFAKRKRTIYLLDPVAMNMRRMTTTVATLQSEREAS